MVASTVLDAFHVSLNGVGKKPDYWSPNQQTGCICLFPHVRLDNSEFSEHQRREQMQVTERIIGHECISLSQ